jgi:hypothetical protein
MCGYGRHGPLCGYGTYGLMIGYDRYGPLCGYGRYGIMCGYGRYGPLCGYRRSVLMRGSGRYGLPPDYSIYDLLVRRRTTLQSFQLPVTLSDTQSFIPISAMEVQNLVNCVQGRRSLWKVSVISKKKKSFTKLSTEDAVT